MMHAVGRALAAVLVAASLCAACSDSMKPSAPDAGPSAGQPPSGGGSASAAAAGAAGSSSAGSGADPAGSGSGGPDTAGGPERVSCPPPSGVYEGNFTELSGDCGPLDEPIGLRFDGGVSGQSTNIERRADGQVSLSVVLAPCRLDFERTTADGDGVPESVLEGDGLIIGADASIRGTVTLTRLDPSGATTCSGTYEAVFTAAESATLGAASNAGSDGFAAEHLAEIEGDCTQTVACRASMGADTPLDAVDRCVEDTGNALDGDPARQATFLAAYARCDGLVACDYLSCATSR